MHGFRQIVNPSSPDTASFDVLAIGLTASPRVWEDPQTRIVFSAGPAGGLYRRQSGL